MEKITSRTRHTLGAICITMIGLTGLQLQPFPADWGFLLPAAGALMLYGMMEQLVAGSETRFAQRRYAKGQTASDKDPQPSVIYFARMLTQLVLCVFMVACWVWKLDAESGLAHQAKLNGIVLFGAYAIWQFFLLRYLVRVVFLTPEQYIAYQEQQQKEKQAREEARQARERNQKLYTSSRNDAMTGDAGGAIFCDASDCDCDGGDGGCD